MLSFFTHFIQTYSYSSGKEFLCSLMPSIKYDLTLPSLSISAIIGIVSHYLGVGPLIAVGMFVAIVLEVVSGMMASQKLNVKFESFKFSRCVIKLAIWLAIIFFVNAFQVEYSDKTMELDSIAYNYFSMVKLGVMFLFIVEHLSSILENMAVINGKEKTTYISSVKDLLSQGYKLLFNFIKK